MNRGGRKDRREGISILASIAFVKTDADFGPIPGSSIAFFAISVIPLFKNLSLCSFRTHLSSAFAFKQVFDRFSFAQPHEIVPGLADGAPDRQIFFA
jgi:hypothetical protein